MPSGFLPISAGNVRHADVVQVYRQAPLFQDLRNYEKLKGKCRICEYREVCGGQRGRAYGLTGDYMESDPSCVYIPAGISN
jgi:radical SAM protein with 4Fe4S-binding SPASM domain